MGRETIPKPIMDAWTAHASLVLPAWTILAPLGAILIRIVPSTRAWIIHAGAMLFALSVFTTGAGVGIWRMTADGYKIGSTAHTILGVTVLSIAWTQPFSGLIHHYMSVRTGQRTILSVLHVFIGRLLITAGMINAGLGLLLAGNSTRAENIVFGTIAGIVWTTYILTSFFYEAKRSNDLKSEILASKSRARSSSSGSFDRETELVTVKA